MSTMTAVKMPVGEPVALSGGDRAELGQRAWRGLLRAHACLAKRLDAELDREHGLPMSSYEVLAHLAEASEGRMRMRDLAERAQLSRSGLTRLVDRLEKQGLVERDRSAADRRHSITRITKKGLALIEELNAEVGELFKLFGVSIGSRTIIPVIHPQYRNV